MAGVFIRKRVASSFLSAYIMTMHYHLFETAIGTCGIGWTENAVVRFQLPDTETGNTEEKLKRRVPDARNAQKADGPLPPFVQDAIAQLRRYFEGEAQDFSKIPVDVSHTDDLRHKIYDELRTIGFGKTVTYGELARRIGASGPEAPRVVGQAMGSNPVPVIIPCHRVLAAGNKIGGFSAPGGTATKEKLLALEGVQIGEPVLPGLFG
jgi:methylated-DNA-[protein]-cysteine S-methyltransferase